MQKRIKAGLKWWILCFLLLAVVWGALFFGRYMVSPKEVLHILWNGLRGVAQEGIEVSVVLEIRLPRVLKLWRCLWREAF